MKTSGWRAAAAILLVGAIAGCAAKGPVKPKPPLPRVIALLPMANHSNSMLGPVLARNLLETRLIGSGYDITDPAKTDAGLKTIGITDGGQLRSATPQKLGQVLNVDGLLYGELLEFKYTNIGVFSKRSVEIKLTLVDAKTGEKLWEASKRESSSKTGFSKDAIKENLARGLGTQLLETALKSPLRPETETVTQSLVKALNKERKSRR